MDEHEAIIIVTNYMQLLTQWNKEEEEVLRTQSWKVFRWLNQIILRVFQFGKEFIESLNLESLKCN